ncbi:MULTISPECIES: DUF4349 domain-containing protein [unclassified Treponema]|uniref:DUF4349 domain-containing protein n=1 Tax=unclassified Treponema TaxID=2638727 RepID=UPI0020A4E622|nr:MULTISPECIES: DUF4349 domain-containing protein [unclassified Treponema]UTC67145.1 DUF4349 domain-containing protein [Treponema sp. OMZ 789]UTC69875.1 DUF4349 domain-containing protein [Treponema sp. OMZ 790]UTC72590.1 DUF4349 domain-containing protein [Treponema sp. OMZ 791]
MKHIVFKFLYLSLALSIFLSCSVKKDSYADTEENRFNAYSAESKSSSTDYEFEIAKRAQTEDKNTLSLDARDIERKLIKTGFIEFETDDIKKTREIIENLVSKYQAYISQEDEKHFHSSIRQTISIRIPKENFENFLNEITAGIKNLDNKNITVEDVTEEFVDSLARLKVKKETEQTYLKILSQAKTVKDILEVQNQIQDLRSDIEAIEGRLRYLQKSVNYSTLNISMYQIINGSIARPAFFTKALNAVKDGIGLFSDIILGILYLWIFILIIAVILMIVIKKRTARKAKKEENLN